VYYFDTPIIIIITGFFPYAPLRVSVCVYMWVCVCLCLCVCVYVCLCVQRFLIDTPAPVFRPIACSKRDANPLPIRYRRYYIIYSCSQLLPTGKNKLPTTDFFPSPSISVTLSLSLSLSLSTHIKWQLIQWAVPSVTCSS